MPRPEKPDQTDEALGIEPVSRLAKLQSEGIEPEMPPLFTPWLFSHLMEAGPVEAGGMDRVPLSWGEIGEWSDRTRTPLAPWEARMIRRASTEYLSEVRRAEKPDCPPPWGEEMTEDRRELVNRKLNAMFAMFDAG